MEVISGFCLIGYLFDQNSISFFNQNNSTLELNESGSVCVFAFLCLEGVVSFSHSLDFSPCVSINCFDIFPFLRTAVHGSVSTL